MFSTKNFLTEISRQEPLISCILDISILDLLGLIQRQYMKIIIYHLIWLTHFCLITFSSTTGIVQSLIFKSNQAGIIHNFTMHADAGFKYIEKFREGLQWYMVESNDFISNISFKLKKENGDIVSFNGESKTLRLSSKAFLFLSNVYENNKNRLSTTS